MQQHQSECDSYHAGDVENDSVYIITDVCDLWPAAAAAAH